MVLNKTEIYEEVKKRALADPEIGGFRPTGRCFFWAMHAVEVIRELGVRAVLQAGSAGWKMIRPEDDDGVCMTHFSYMWSPDDPNSLHAVQFGRMPEMHVWAGIPSEQTLVDMTTGFWPEQAKLLKGFEWKADPPPPYFWGTAQELGENGGFYKPERKAVELTLRTIFRMYGQDRVKGLL
jgi:hypothetical protein